MKYKTEDAKKHTKKAKSPKKKPAMKRGASEVPAARIANAMAAGGARHRERSRGEGEMESYAKGRKRSSGGY